MTRGWPSQSDLSPTCPQLVSHFSVKCWEEGARHTRLKWSTTADSERAFHTRGLPKRAMSVLSINWETITEDSVMVSSEE